LTRVRWLALLVSLFLAPFCQLVAPSAATVSSAATSAALAAIPTATTTSTATALWTYDRPADVALTRHRALSTGLTAMSAISQSVIRASAPDWRLAAEGGADGQSILEQAAQGQGNFGLGSADATQANELGNEWVGDNARLSSNGKALVSQDGLRQFRFPSFKPSWGNYQANFESRLTPSGPWTSNGHLAITFGPPAP